MKETYKAAHARLLLELIAAGWFVRRFNHDGEPMVRPWALPVGAPTTQKLYFHAQAVYVGERSLWLDTRGATIHALIGAYEAHVAGVSP